GVSESSAGPAACAFRGDGMVRAMSTSRFFSTRGESMNRRSVVKALTLAASIAAVGAAQAFARQKTAKAGILHSLSGTMAISETVLKDTVLMAIEEINAKGGVMGAKIEPVVVDPASNWPLFAEKAR